MLTPSTSSRAGFDRGVILDYLHVAVNEDKICGFPYCEDLEKKAFGVKAKTALVDGLMVEYCAAELYRGGAYKE